MSVIILTLYISQWNIAALVAEEIGKGMATTQTRSQHIDTIPSITVRLCNNLLSFDYFNIISFFFYIFTFVCLESWVINVFEQLNINFVVRYNSDVIGTEFGEEFKSIVTEFFLGIICAHLSC